MEPVPHNGNHKTIEGLRQQCARAVSERGVESPGVRLYETDLQHLTECIIAGMSDATHMEKGLAKASDAHYERVANELIEFLDLYPENARRALRRLLWLIEYIPGVRQQFFDEKLAATQ